MGKIDMLGMVSPLKSGPADETLDSFPGGTMQIMGDQEPLKRSNTPMGQFTDQSMGTVEMVGMDVGKLSRKPHRGYEAGTQLNANDGTPDSERSF